MTTVKATEGSDVIDTRRPVRSPAVTMFGRVADSDAVRFARHLGRLVSGCFAYAVVSRRVTLLLAVVIGLALLAIGLAGQAAAPFVVYPFV